MFSLNIPYRGKAGNIVDLAEVSKIYCTLRDRSGEGCSTFRDGVVKENGKTIGFVSYNGKIWPGSDYDPAATPLYNPYA